MCVKRKQYEDRYQRHPKLLQTGASTAEVSIFEWLQIHYKPENKPRIVTYIIYPETTSGRLYEARLAVKPRVISSVKLNSQTSFGFSVIKLHKIGPYDIVCK